MIQIRDLAQVSRVVNLCTLVNFYIISLPVSFKLIKVLIYKYLS